MTSPARPEDRAETERIEALKALFNEPLKVAYDPSIMFPGLDEAEAVERLRRALGAS